MEHSPLNAHKDISEPVVDTVVFDAESAAAVESIDWVTRQQFDGIGGATRLDGLLRDIEDAPDLDDVAAHELVRTVAATSDRNKLATVLSRYTTRAASEEQIGMYVHAEEVAELIDHNAELVRFMARQSIGIGAGQYQGGDAPSILDAFDQAERRDVREALVYHANVLTDEKAADWAKNISHALLRLNVVESGIATTQVGAVGFNGPSRYRSEDNALGDIAVPLATPLSHMSATAGIDTARKPIATMSDDEKRIVLSETFIAEHLDLTKVDQVLLMDLTPDRQAAVVSVSLIDSIEKSHNPTERARATERNIAAVRAGAFLRSGDLVHTANASSLDLILHGGLVAGELIGENSQSDAYPLNVDFNRVEPSDLVGSFSAQIDAATHGFHQKGDRATTITYIIPREHAFADRPANVSDTNHKHRLAFAAVPATEIGGIVLNDMSTEGRYDTEIAVLEATLGADVYYPVFSGTGELLLTPEEYTAKTSRRLNDLRALSPSGTEGGARLVDTQPLARDFTIPDIGVF